MKAFRVTAILFLVVVSATCLLADFVAPASYAQQFRDVPNADCSSQHLLGTDDLRRDRFSRLLYGTRVSLLLAPAAALLSSLLAALIRGQRGVCRWLAGKLRDGRDRPVPVFAVAVSADFGSRVSAPQRRTLYVGGDYVCDARLAGMGRSSAGDLRGCPHAVRL